MTETTQDTAVLNPEELAEAKRYGHRQLLCMLLDKALDVIYLSIAAFMLAIPLDRWLQGFSWLAQSASLRLMALFVLITAIHLAISFPLSFYSSHILEHQFHLSKLSFSGWLWRYIKRHLLGLVFGMVMLLGLYWLIWTTGSIWWMVAAGVFFLVSIVLGQLAPVLILPLFYKIEKLNDEGLNERIAHLSEGTGLSIEGVYRMQLSEETSKANAMLAGLGSTRRVLLGDTLLDGFTPEEIEIIFAHEIGHHVFHHIRKMIVSGVFYSAVGFWICDRILTAWSTQVSGSFSYSEFPVYTLPLLMLILTLFGMILEPVQNVVSRHFERQADGYALKRTGNREAYVSAFRKLAKLNKDDPDPHWLEVALFHSHPPIGERLLMASEMVLDSGKSE